jgi:catechol 2,3-dioxygenase-like lactoylglutathione lyase family enzyme
MRGCRRARAGLALACGAWLAAPAIAAEPAAPPPAGAQAGSTTAIGRHDNEFILAKIAVSDMVRSYRFYTEVIGLKLASPLLRPPAPGDPEKDFVEYPLNFTGSLADPFFVLVKQRGLTPTPAAARLVTIGFKVPGARAAVARAEAAGYKSLRGIPGEGPMAFGFITDPDGYHIEFVQAANHR